MTVDGDATSPLLDHSCTPPATPRRRRPPAVARAPRSDTARAHRGVGTGGLRQEHPPRRVVRRRPRDRMALPGGARQRRGALLVLRRRRAPDRRARRRRPRSRCSGPRDAGGGRRSRPCSTSCTPSTDDVVLVLDDYHVIDSPEIHDAMTFFARPPSRRGSTSWSPAGPTRRAARPLARPRRPARDPRRRPALHRRRGRRLPQRRDGPRARRRRRRRARGPHRRLDRRAAARRAVDAGPRRRLRVHRRASPATTASSSTTSSSEVLQRQPERRSGRFLLQTSVLDRLTGALCDAVTGRTGGKATLEQLDRANLFVVPLDDRRDWYRYHHLFADVLRARLLDERPGPVAELHRRASAWYDAHGDPSDAIRHALAGERPRPRRRAHRAGGAGDAPDPPGGDACAAGSRPCPTRSSRDRPVLTHRPRRRADGRPASPPRSSRCSSCVEATAGTRATPAADRRSTTTSSPGSRPRSRCTAPRWR